MLALLEVREYVPLPLEVLLAGVYREIRSSGSLDDLDILVEVDNLELGLVGRRFRDLHVAGHEHVFPVGGSHDSFPLVHVLLEGRDESVLAARDVHLGLGLSEEVTFFNKLEDHPVGALEREVEDDPVVTTGPAPGTNQGTQDLGCVTNGYFEVRGTNGTVGESPECRLLANPTAVGVAVRPHLVPDANAEELIQEKGVAFTRVALRKFVRLEEPRGGGRGEGGRIRSIPGDLST